MSKEQFENYKFSYYTEVLYQGEWTAINEVWFREGKIGLKKSGLLVNYWEVDEARG